MMKGLWPKAVLGIGYVSRAIKPSVLLVTTLLASATYAITAPTNTAPVLTVGSSYSANEEAELVFKATASDDMLPARVLTFSLVDAPEGAVINPVTGQFKWTPAELPAPDSKTYTFKVRVSDTALYTEKSVMITVNKVNRAPVLNVIGDKTVNEKTTLTFSLTATDTDLPPASLIWSVSDAPEGATFGGGQFNWTPTEEQGPGSYTITFEVSDGLVRVDQSITVTVNEVNDAPSGADKTLTINEDASHVFSVADFGFSDSNDSPESNLLAVIISSLPSEGDLTLNGIAVVANQIIYAADIASGKLVFTPAANASGDGYSSFTFQVQDDGGTDEGGVDTDQSAKTIRFDVISLNDAPLLSGTPATQVDRGAAYRFVPTVSDADDDALSFSATGLPTWLSVNSETGEVSGTAPVAAIGESYAIELTVSDGVESASLSWNLAVVLQIGDITGLWLKDGELANERFGGSLALFDAMGDGLAEVYVGSPTRTVEFAGKKLKNAGGVDVLASGNGALLHRVNATVAKQRFGSALAVVADQNNDGIEDLVVGKPFAGKGGEIALHSGDDGSLIRTLVKGEGKTASSIVSMIPLCAIDPQNIVCRILGSSEQGGRIGYSLAVADIDDSDGADLIVGLPQANVRTPVKLNKAGSVIVYQGLTDTPRYVLSGQQAGERFGSSVAADDNYLLVGSPNFDVQAAKKLKDAGRVQLFNLQDGSVAGAAEGKAAKQLLGSAVASFNQDVNGDGEPDWAVAGAGDKSGKPVKLFSGVTSPVPFAEIAVTALNKVDAIRLVSGMDINGDGVSDLVIGLPNTKITVPFSNKTKTLKNAGQVQVISGANWAP